MRRSKARVLRADAEPAELKARLFASDALTGFSAGPCNTTSGSFWSDPEVPALGQVFMYLYLPLNPFEGSWGEASSSVTRDVVCAADLMGACSTLNSEYQAALDQAKSYDSA